MITSTVSYDGQLRTTLTHHRSGSTIHTDAPVDNHGLGSTFSPTDLVATGLAACMITVIGIKAKHEGFEFYGAHADVTKHMASDPRRISKVEVELKLAGSYTDEQRAMMEEWALNCPVAKSLHPDIDQDVRIMNE